MKTLFLLATAALLSPISALAQDASASSLNNGNVSLFFNSDGGIINAEYPISSGKTAGGGIELWVATEDLNGNKTVLNHHRDAAQNNFEPGVPLELGDPSLGAIENATRQPAWVSRKEIMEHLVGYATSSNILNWPASGNQNLNLPNRQLAPFVDINGNGKYEPLQGDYPDIKGDYAAWLSIREKAGAGSSGLKMEIHILYYMYENSMFEKQFFAQYELINQSNEAWIDTRLALNLEMDLGNPFDDFVAASSSNSSVILYNGDNVDELRGGYGMQSDIPAVTYSLIESPSNQNGDVEMASFVSYVSDQGNTGVPQTANERYNYMIGRWRNGDPLRYGRDGIIGSYDYPIMYDLSRSNNSWTECAASSLPGDRNGLMSTTPYTIYPGESAKYVFTTRINHAPTGFDCNIISTLPNSIDQNAGNWEGTKDCSNFPPAFQIYTSKDLFGNGEGSAEIKFYSTQEPSVVWSNGSTSEVAENLTAGIHHVAIYWPDCMEVVDVEIIGQSTSIDEIEEDLWNVYPNPSSDYIKVRNAQTIDQIQIFDINGRMVINTKDVTNQINISHLSPGLYIVKGVNMDGAVDTKRLEVL